MVSELGLVLAADANNMKPSPPNPACHITQQHPSVTTDGVASWAPSVANVLAIVSAIPFRGNTLKGYSYHIFGVCAGMGLCVRSSLEIAAEMFTRRHLILNPYAYTNTTSS